MWCEQRSRVKSSVSENFPYKLEMFSDGYASPKFIPHEIFLTEIF